MWVKKLKFSNIRNHSNTELDFSRHINILYGLNGTGKTSVLEALSIGAFSKSFISSPESTIINYEKDFFRTIVNVERDRNTEFWVEVDNHKNKRKKISSSFMDNMSPKNLIGSIPMIILSPDYKEITAGSPSHRRKFIDTTISQISHSYLNDLIDYKKVLKQRNNLLTRMAKDRTISNEELELWTDKLIELSTKLIKKRSKFIEEFKPHFLKNYEMISGGKEKVDLHYAPYGFSEEFQTEIPEDTIKEKLNEMRENYKERERYRQTTLYGPQKDDIILQIGHGIARETASQGQHKSILISLKMAEFDYIKEVMVETPIVLLDDIFSELDKERTKLVIDIILNNLAQAFVTVTESEKIRDIMKASESCYYFEVNNGNVEFEPFEYDE